MRPLHAITLMAALFLTGCATTTDRVLDTGDKTQLQKRSYQSRIFDTSDKEKVLRAAISTLQDLGFVIDRADLTLGMVSGTKLEGYQIKITVSVRPKGNDRMVVRANAQFNVTPIDDPKQYQDFFASLEKSLFLAAHAVE
jgi:hypothetical protein